jgi:peptidoglycan/xylan/chitin deacetylase (PgdA/CDA1 family)
MTNLWCGNSPRNFWLCQPDPPEEAWLEAYQKALPSLGLSHPVDDIDAALSLTLGEGQFGYNHWKLSPTKQLYYALKPALPRSLRYVLRRQYSQLPHSDCQIHWPIEDRYICFQFEVARQLLITLDRSSMSFRYFWPEGSRYAFVLTHDVETEEGQAYVRAVADLEECFGFRSSFNFVPERYELDLQLMQELRERGFEIGVHGLKHDGKLFGSKHLFMERAGRVNQYLKEFGAVGFRAPLMMRNPDWLQALEVEYDLSFFDTDPYEPMPGGVMSIWPFTIGHFVELQYTLPQDSTLYVVFSENTPRIWFDKIDFIECYHGMGLLNTHPDYLRESKIWNIYVDFLQTMKKRGSYWHALPREVARWWRRRAETLLDSETLEMTFGTILLNGDRITLSSPLRSSRE